jgi:hypothetical protein
MVSGVLPEVEEAGEVDFCGLVKAEIAMKRIS